MSIQADFRFNKKLVGISISILLLCAHASAQQTLGAITGGPRAMLPVATTTSPYGNAGRNLFRGPLELRFDMSLAKEFAISERVRARLA